MSAPLRQAEIDLDAYRANLERVRGWMHPVEVMAIMKADAYGHGLEPIALAAVDAGIRWIGVLTVPAALRLRAIGVGEDVHLFTWQHDPALDFRDAIDSAVDLGVSNLAELQRIVEAVDQRPARVHLGVDTGLHRDGSSIDDWPALVEAARDAQRAGRIEVVAAYTHLAESSDDDDAASVSLFEAAIERAEDLGVDVPMEHVAASLAGLERKEFRKDMVRMGANLYGIPGADGVSAADLGLEPVMTVTASVAKTKRVPVGTGVSYDYTYRTDDETTLALVPFGYADGVPRSAQGRVEVAINGKRYPVAGRVAMDQFLVDVGDDDVQVGDTVVLFGTGERDEMTVLEWGAALDTIGEEIVCRIGARVPRVYSGHSVEGRVGEYLRGEHA
ncbi:MULTISPECIES: alanine racemase [unclassified Curtobacterium]|uniref:alanine racemase n=1 Tax=unclassified Curtobacterium TaxID=257496 RepID=UPI00188C693A|nr:MULTISPECIES: alanine racemase [unclassified Curtobacterium]MBF4591781.1 alanine racemase [Curtobacterium sp. VKM Ac-1395]MCY1693271.1 alanine racemase [Curtobacterium sp. SL109]